MEFSLTNPLLWIALYLIIAAVRKLTSSRVSKAKHEKLVQKAKECREKRDRDFHKFIQKHNKDMPDEKVQKLIDSCDSLADLQKGLTKKQFTSVELLMYYIKKCYTYGLKLCLITQLNFEDAFKMAKECDETRKDPQKLKQVLEICEDGGLLYGIPVSFKDHLFMKNTMGTMGCANMLDYVHPSEGMLEKWVKQNGGIPFVKTNVPMLNMSMECNNRIFGRGRNPIKHDRVPGGSSGGCAGLVACKGTSISFGSDIGGSVRGPATF